MTRVLSVLSLALLFALPAFAGDSKIEIRVIEATPGMGPKKVDKRLKKLARDLKPLPFKSFEVTDQHRKVMKPKERVSFQFPGPKGEKRFLKVTSHGRQRGGNLRFQLSIQKLRFDTLVAVPDGGTILVGGPRHGGEDDLLRGDRV